MMIDTNICNQNIELIAANYKKRKPVRLHSFTGFEQYEASWWEQFNAVIQNSPKNKFNYTPDMNIPVLDLLAEHFFSKIFTEHKIVCWVSKDENDTGTDWHKDYEAPSNPTYLIALNLVGDTSWHFTKAKGIDMSPGSCLAYNGSFSHKVVPKGMRITLAGHSGINSINL